jgi:PAS domain S-box-containing protein
VRLCGKYLAETCTVNFSRTRHHNQSPHPHPRVQDATLSEEEFRNLADAMPQLVWMADPDGWIFWFNQRWFEYTGTTPEQMEGWGWQSVHDPEILPAVLERWKASLATGTPFEMTFPLRGADGVLRPFLTRVTPVRDPQGKITRWFGTNTDVSAEVAAREELRKNQERLQFALLGSQRLAAIVASSDDAIVSKDLHGIVSSWNPAAERIFGYTAQEMIGRSITTIIPPELHDDERRILETIGRGERIEHFETLRLTKSGERIEVSLTISPVKDETGRIIGAAKIARDITQHKKAERALQMTERLASVGRLAATVAHEINNPLEAVTNLVYLARQSAIRKDVREFLAGAEQELDRISHLTRQTLGFYRETKGARAMSIGSVIEPLVEVFAPRARNKKVKIEPEIKGDPKIYAVPGEIRQLIANLISNSVDAVDEGGRVRVRVSAARQWNSMGTPGVRVTVADSGPGIPPSIRSQLFEPFFTTKKEVGTGLGLWVCKTIVDKHRGSIRVKSSSRPGQSWTAFSIFLPANPQVNSESEDPQPLKLAV